MDIPSLADINKSAELVKESSGFAYKLICTFFPKFPGWVAGRRAQQYINECIAVNEKLNRAGIPPEQRRYCSLKLGIPWVENASLEDDPILQEMWANLMANALNPNFEEKALRTAFVSIIKELSVTDVKVIRYFMKHGRARWSFEQIGKGEPSPIKISAQIAAVIDETTNDVEVSLCNLKRLELMDNKHQMTFHVSEYRRGSTGVNQIIASPRHAVAESYYYFTELGLAFLDACVRDAGEHSAEASEGNTDV